MGTWTTKFLGKIENMSDYDSDEAPEAINFTTSKSLALQQVKAAAEAIKVSKEKDKEAKKKREELFKQQKEDKVARLEELKKNAPSDDIFDQLPDKFVRTPKPRSSKAPVRTEFIEDESKDEEVEDEEETEDFISLLPKRKVKRVKLREEEHGATKFRIMSRGDQRSTCHISKSVLNFKNAKLYGHLSKVKRETAQERERRLQKMKYSGKGAF